MPRGTTLNKSEQEYCLTLSSINYEKKNGSINIQFKPMINCTTHRKQFKNHIHFMSKWICKSHWHSQNNKNPKFWTSVAQSMHYNKHAFHNPVHWWSGHTSLPNISYENCVGNYVLFCFLVSFKLSRMFKMTRELPVPVNTGGFKLNISKVKYFKI